MTRGVSDPPGPTPAKATRRQPQGRKGGRKGGGGGGDGGGGPGGSGPGTGSPPVSDETADQYREKLIKYVPAEAIAFFTLGFAALKPNEDLADAWYVALIIVGLLI